MRRLLALGLLFGATPALAQEPWRSSYFPYVLGNPTDGFVGAFRWQRTQNAPYFLERSDQEDVINPITFRGAVSAEAGAGTYGSRFVRLEARLPGLSPGWRFHSVLAAERQGRYGRYGFGSDLDIVVPGVDPNDNLYRIHRTRYLARAEVTRTIAGPLRLSLGTFFDHTRFTPLSGSAGGIRRSRSNLQIRPVLVLDTRDREAIPGKGVLLEFGAGFGTGPESPGGAKADQSVYGFAYGQIKAYQSIRPGTVLAARALVRTLEDQAPMSARSTVWGWEREFDLSGSDGHRSFPMGTLSGGDVTLLTAELRHDLLNAGDFGAVTVIGFLDWARVADSWAANPKPTKQLGAGGGLALRVLRSAILTANFAGGSNGFNFSMGTAWAF